MDDRKYEKWLAILEVLETHRGTNASNRWITDRVLQRLEELEKKEEELI